MRKWIAGAAVAAALIGGGSAIAVASTSSSGHSSTTTTVASPPPPTPAKGKHGKHDKGAMKPRELLKGAVEVSAKTIGVDPKELVGDLKAGQSVSDVATAHNVDPQKVIDALVADGNNKIDQAVTAKKITPEQATKIKAKLPALAAKFVNRHKGATPTPGSPSGPSSPAPAPSTSS